MDEIKQSTQEELEANMDCILRLDSDNRCISMDCLYLDTDKTISIKRKDLPLEYIKFSRVLNDYKYINSTFVLAPIENEPTFEEQQMDFNIEIDYRVSCVELGLN